MKTKTKKLLALLLALALLAGLGWFANGMVGNPISRRLAARTARAYMDEAHPGTDYVLDKPFFSFKDGYYYVDASSPSSQDSDFTMAIDWKGGLRWDSYEDNVLHRDNTARRLEREYRELVDKILENPAFPYPDEIQYGTLELYPQEALDDPLATDIPDWALAAETLELDRVYDVSALGREVGTLVLYVDQDEVTPERAARVLLDLRRSFDEAGVGFHFVNLTLEKTPVGEEPHSDERIYANLLYEDIREEGLADRVIASDRAQRGHYEQMDAEKQAEITE